MKKELLPSNMAPIYDKDHGAQRPHSVLPDGVGNLTPLLICNPHLWERLARRRTLSV